LLSGEFVRKTKNCSEKRWCSTLQINTETKAWHR